MEDNNEELFNSIEFSAMKDAAIQLHELHVNFVSAGFSVEESLTMIAKIIADAQRQ